MSSNGELAFADATEIARRIREREIGARECLEFFIERVERYDGDVRAFVVLDLERARADADEADRALAAGRPVGPLHGVPMSVKEAFDLEGHPTTFGIPAFAGSRADRDAAIVTSLRRAGAVIFGKTNVPLGLVDFQSYNAIYGATSNPWDLTRTPGGSSGGESAALAAGLCALGYGSDIGGSLRNPAHYTGTFAHKPTYGIVPHSGHSPVFYLDRQDLGVFGPMARSARDLELALDLTVGPVLGHGVGWKLDLPRRTRPLGELRVAVWPDHELAPVSSEIAARCLRLGEDLAKLGARVSDRARPSFEPERAHSCYVKLLQSALSLSRPRDEYFDTLRHASRFDPGDASLEARGAWNQVMTHRTWLEICEERERLRADWAAFFEDWDLVIAPIGCTHAFPHDHSEILVRTVSVDGVERPYFNQLFWAGIATGSYLPSTAIPTGPDSDGLPIGVQLIGPAYHDHFLIDVAMQLESHGYCFQPPPGYAS